MEGVLWIVCNLPCLKGMAETKLVRRMYAAALYIRCWGSGIQLYFLLVLLGRYYSDIAFIADSFSA